MPKIDQHWRKKYLPMSKSANLIEIVDLASKGFKNHTVESSTIIKFYGSSDAFFWEQLSIITTQMINDFYLSTLKVGEKNVLIIWDDLVTLKETAHWTKQGFD